MQRGVECALIWPQFLTVDYLPRDIPPKFIKVDGLYLDKAVRGPQSVIPPGVNMEHGIMLFWLLEVLETFPIQQKTATATFMYK